VGGDTVGFPYACFLLGYVKQVIIALVRRMHGNTSTRILCRRFLEVTRKFTLDYGLLYDYSPCRQD
jgi:hypothetical protein